MTKNKTATGNAFRVFIRVTPVVVKAAPILFFIQMFLDWLNGFSLGLIVVFQQRLFDAAINMVRSGESLSIIAPSFIQLAIAYFCYNALSGISHALYREWIRKAEGRLTYLIHDKANRLNPEAFENPVSLDDINKAKQGVRHVSDFVHTPLSTIGTFVIYYVTIAGYLASYKPSLSLAVVIMFLPSLFMQVVRARAYTGAEDESAPLRREYDHYEECMVSREYYKETRLFGGYNFFNALYMDTLKSLQKIMYRAFVRVNRHELLARVFTVTGYILILLMLFNALMQKEITIGVFSAVFASMGFMFQKMEELVHYHIGSMARYYGTVRNYIAFQDMPDRGGRDVALPGGGDIELENVSFGYPGKPHDAVKDVTLKINAGEILAVVGENGSGKSTLVRLITGMYLPREGKVLHAGHDTRDVSLRSLSGSTSAVFQKYQRYQMTLRDNISISQIDANDKDDLALDGFCEKSGVYIRNGEYVDGYDTMLSREFGGIDLSGGQWQRVAIARGYFRGHKFIIMDEPTASIDPLEETRIYQSFAEISRGKTVIIVTHRLGSVLLADRIIVMRDGLVVQEGAHSALLEDADGEYFRLYNMQKKWYT